MGVAQTDLHDYAIEVCGITKRFPGGVTANDNVTMRVRKGEIHAVLGENGAGKTTLMNILYGMIAPDEGEVRIFGKKASFTSPVDAIKAGIGMVHQHFMLVPSFTVAENVVLGYEPTTMRVRFDSRAAEREVNDLAARYELDVTPQAIVRDLSVGERQRVEIMKILRRRADIIILDEPTAVLTPQEVKALFKTLKSLVASGKTVILITHKLSEALSIADTITVLRTGKVQGSLDRRDATPELLTRMIIGEEQAADLGARRGTRETPGIPRERVVLQATDIVVQDSSGRTVVNGVSLTVREGEILGVAGVEGNGQEELIEALVGLRPTVRGEIVLNGRSVTGKSTWFRRHSGLSYVPSDRLEVGSAGEATIAENLLAGNQRREPFAHRSVLRWKHVNAHSERLMKKYDIRAAGPHVKARTLSGGNLQRVVLARELAFDSKVVIVSQPTRGLDIRSASLVHKALKSMRDNGAGILMVSSDLDEVLAISDRVIVLYEGKVAGEFDPSTSSVEEIGFCMLGSRQLAGSRSHSLDVSSAGISQ